MAFERDFLELMPHTISIADLSSVNGYGEETYSTSATSYRCRWVHAPEVVVNFLGEEVVSTDTVWMASTSLPSATAQYTLPNGSTPHLLQIWQYPDEDGTHHIKLSFGGAGGGGGPVA